MASLCRELGILPPRLHHLPGEKVVETLLKPSEMRFELLCAAFQTFCPELEGELVELKPGPRKTLEEIRFQHVLDFCHDVGIFDEGDEIDMMKIKGELNRKQNRLSKMNLIGKQNRKGKLKLKKLARQIKKGLLKRKGLLQRMKKLKKRKKRKQDKSYKRKKKRNEIGVQALNLK